VVNQKATMPRYVILINRKRAIIALVHTVAFRMVAVITGMITVASLRAGPSAGTWAITGILRFKRYTMAKSINKVILIGNVGKDPDVKYTPSGVALAKFSLATNEKFKDKSGEWQERTEWHNVLAWQRLAEIVGEYVQKGAKLFIEGRLQTSSWEDRNSGEKKYRVEIVAHEIVLLGSLEADSDGHRGQAQEECEPVHAGVGEITDEDIPF
jgi:single-strand DNA-binding protein